MKIYIEDKIKKGERISTYILRLYATKWSFPATYSNEDCTEEECPKGKSRSVEALYYIMKTQRPKLKKKHFLKQLRYVTNKKGFFILGCHNIKKSVVYDWRGNPSSEQLHFKKRVYDYCNHYSKKMHKLHKGKFSIQKILKGMDYSKEEIKKTFAWT